MSLFSRTPDSAIGIAVDGLSVRAAHLRRKDRQVVLAGLESATLKTRIDVEAGAAEAEAQASAEDVLGLAPTAGDQPAGAEPEGTDAQTQETNSSVLFELLNKLPVSESTVALGLLENSVSMFNVEGVQGLKEKQVRRRVLEEVLRARGGVPPTEDEIDYIPTARGALALVHEDRMELLGLLDELRPFFGKLRIGLIDANEISLLNLVRRSTPPDDRVTAIVYIGEGNSRAIFARGGEYIGLTQVINEGYHSPQVLNTIYSRILFEQDTSSIPEIHRLVLAGAARAIDARAFFVSQFPDTEVEYLVPSGLDMSLLKDDQKGSVSEFDIPIGLALKVLEPRNKRFYATNCLPKERKRLQNPFEIAWHGLVLVALIALTVPFSVLRLRGQDRSVSSLSNSIHMMERQVEDNTAFVKAVDSLQNLITWHQQSLALTDSLSAQHRAWDPLIGAVTEETERVNSLWFTGLTGGKENAVLTGRSLYRDRIPAIAEMLDSAVVRTITRSQIRTREVYDFEIEVKSFKPLGNDAPAEPPEQVPSVPEDEEPSTEVQTRPYIIHLGVYANRESAEDRASRLHHRGYPAWVSEGRATRWGRFVVSVGTFGSLQEARAVEERLRREEGLESWIYRLRGMKG